MTGAELIAFIEQNNLKNEEITIEYFSIRKEEKYCNGCKSIVNLEDFHRISNFDEESSSGYKHLCKVCFRKKYTKPKSKINWDHA